MEFHTMKRKELQALCRKHNIHANLSTLEMANKLSSLLQEKGRPMTRGRSRMKGSAEIGVGSGFDAVNREIKKVSFSPENETIEFVQSVERRAMMTRAGKRKLIANPVAKTKGFLVGNIGSFGPVKEIVDSPVRVTRSRAQIVREEGVGVENKRGKRKGKEVDGSDRPPPVSDTENVASENDDVGEEIKGPARRSSRKRGAMNEIEKHFEGIDVVGSRKSMRHRSSDVKSSNTLTDDRSLAKDGGVAPTEMASRRSKGTTGKTAESEKLNDAESKLEMAGRGRSTRSCTEQALNASMAERGSITETKVQISKRHTSIQKTTPKSTRKLTEDKGPAKGGRLAYPEMGLRRSKRNMTNTLVSEMLNGAEGKFMVGRGGTTRARNQQAAQASAAEIETKKSTKFKTDRQRSPEKKIGKSIKKLSKDKISGTDGRFAQPEMVLRPTNGIVEQLEDFSMSRGKYEMIERGRRSRSRNQQAVKESTVLHQGKTESEIEVNEKSEVVLVSEKPLQLEDSSDMLKEDEGEAEKVGRSTRSHNQQSSKVENESKTEAEANGNSDVVLRIEKPLQCASRYGDSEKSMVSRAKNGNEAPGQLKEVLPLEESQRHLDSASVGGSSKNLVKENEMVSSPTSTLLRSKRQCVVYSVVATNEETVPYESGSRRKQQKQSAQTPATKQVPSDAEPAKRLTRSALRLECLATLDQQGKNAIGKSKQQKGRDDPILEEETVEEAIKVESVPHESGSRKKQSAETPANKQVPSNAEQVPSNAEPAERLTRSASRLASLATLDQTEKAVNAIGKSKQPKGREDPILAEETVEEATNEEFVPYESGNRKKRQQKSAETPASKQVPSDAEPAERLTCSASRLASLATLDQTGKSVNAIGKSKQQKGREDPILEEETVEEATNEEFVPHESGNRKKRQKQSAETPASKQVPSDAEPAKRLTCSASRLESLASPDQKGKVVNAAGNSKQQKGRDDPILEEETVEENSAGLVEEKTQFAGNSALVTAELPEKKILPGGLKFSKLLLQSPLPGDVSVNNELPAMDTQSSMKEGVETSKAVASSKRKHAYGEMDRKSGWRSYFKDSLERSFSHEENEDASGSQSLGKAGGFSSNELIDAELVRDSGDPADGVFLKVPLACHDDSVFDQIRDMANVKEMETVVEPSPAKVTHPNPVCIGHGSESGTSVHLEQKFVESKELVQPQQSGETIFAHHPDREALTFSELENKDVDDIDKFINVADEQPNMEERPSVSGNEENFTDAVSVEQSAHGWSTEDARDIDKSGGSSSVSEHHQTQDVQDTTYESIPVSVTVLSAPADEAFAKTPFSGDCGLLIDQEDLMGNMEGIESEAGPSSEKVLHPSPDMLDHDVEGTTSPNQDHNHVEFQELVGFSAQSANKSAVEAHFKQLGEANFVNQSEGEEFTTSKLGNKTLEDYEKSLQKFPMQSYSHENLEVEGPSTESVLVVEKLPNEEASLSVPARKQTLLELFAAEEYSKDAGDATDSNLFEGAQKKPSEDVDDTERFVDTDEMQNLEQNIPSTQSIMGQTSNEDTQLLLSETSVSTTKSVSCSSNEDQSGTETRTRTTGRSLMTEHISGEACAELSDLESSRELKGVHVEQTQPFEPSYLENELVNLDKEASFSDLEIFDDEKGNDNSAFQKILNFEQTPPNNDHISGGGVQAINVGEDYETDIPEQEVYYDAELDGGQFKVYENVSGRDTAIGMLECSDRKKGVGDMLEDMDVDSSGSMEAGIPKESLTVLQNLPANFSPGSFVESQSNARGLNSPRVIFVQASISPKHEASAFVNNYNLYWEHTLGDCDESQADSKLGDGEFNQKEPNKNLEANSDREKSVNRNALPHTDEKIMKDGASERSQEVLNRFFGRPGVGNPIEILGINIREDEQLFSEKGLQAEDGPKPNKSLHEPLLGELSSTPVKAVQCFDEKQVPSHEAEFASRTEEMSTSNTWHKEFSQERSPQVVRAKESRHEKIIEGHTSTSKGDIIIQEEFSSVKGGIQLTSCTETPLSKNLYGHSKVAEEKMPSELKSNTKCVNESQMLMERTEPNVLPVGFNSMACNNADKSSTDVIDNLIELGSVFEGLSHNTVEDKFSIAFMEVISSRGRSEDVVTEVTDGNDQEDTEVNFVESHNRLVEAYPEVSMGISSAMKKSGVEEFLAIYDESDHQATRQVGVVHESASLSSEHIIAGTQDDEGAAASLKHVDDAKISKTDSGIGSELLKVSNADSQMFSPEMNLSLGDTSGDKARKLNAGAPNSSSLSEGSRQASKMKENVATILFGVQKEQPHYHMEEVSKAHSIHAGENVASSGPENKTALVEVEESERKQEMDSKGDVTESHLGDENFFELIDLASEDADEAQFFEKKFDIIQRENTDSKAFDRKSPATKRLNSTAVKRQDDARTCLIRATPNKFLIDDMKENNAPSVKREDIGNLSAQKSAFKRHALGDLGK